MAMKLEDWLVELEEALAEEYRKEYFEKIVIDDDNSRLVAVRESILDKSINELLKMDIKDLRKTFIEEIKQANGLSSELRQRQLQSIFEKLLAIEPFNEKDFFANGINSHSLFVDLISTPELRELAFVSDFLDRDFSCFMIDNGMEKRDLLLKILNYYQDHSKDAIDVFNYIFKSSSNVVFFLRRLHPKSFDDYFSNQAMLSFDKEELCQLFRFKFDYDASEVLKPLFANKKALFLISEMTKKVKSITGHGSEFLDCCLDLFKNENFILVLNDVYDQIVGSREKEDYFSKTFMEIDNFTLMTDLINYIVLARDVNSGNGNIFSSVSDMNSFIERVNYEKKYFYKTVLDTYQIILENNHKLENYQSYLETELRSYKQAYLMTTFGISIEEGEYINKFYGRYIDDLGKCVLVEDKDSFEMLQAIKRIVDLDLSHPDFNEEIEVLNRAYLDAIKRHGFEYRPPVASSIIVEGLLNRMYMNTYNNRLLRVDDKSIVIGEDSGVTLIDAGVSFDIILTSFAGVGKFYDREVNMAEKWNTAHLATRQGLSTSHISNENVGIIDLKQPILGFCNIPKDSLNVMGNCDIYSLSRHYNLRKANNARYGGNRYFIPANVMSDETRYGYNEMLLDRFLMQDQDGKLKLQPDYVVYYKMNEHFKEDEGYAKSLELAQAFNIPIVMIDIKKVKANERREILTLEKRLFSKDEVDVDILKEIVTRYMNNYTGSLTLKNYNELEDFSVGYMRRFFNLVLKKIASIDNLEMRDKWIKSLEEVYYLEKEKYEEAKENGVYKYSVKTFILDQYQVEERLFEIQRQTYQEKRHLRREFFTNEDGSLSINNDTSLDNRNIFFEGDSYSYAKSTIVDFLNMLEIPNGTSFNVEHNYNHNDKNGVLLKCYPTVDKEMALIENLVISYFFENYEQTCVSDLISEAPNREFNYNCQGDDDWHTKIMASPYKDLLDPDSSKHIKLNPDKLEFVLDKIEEMSEQNFVWVFRELNKEYSLMVSEKREINQIKLLDKKASIRDAFNLLIQQVTPQIDKEVKK